MRAANRFRAVNVPAQSGQGNYRGLVNESNPARYYRLRISQRSSLNLELSGLRTNANLALVNQSGKIINRSVRGGQRNESIAQTVEPGTYYVRVNRQQGATRYQLNIDLAPAPARASVQPEPGGNSLAEQVVALVNAQRSQAGLAPMRLNPRLSAAAQAHSQDMALNDFFGHIGSSGSTADQRILAAGYNYLFMGENIAAGFATPEGVVQGWMESQVHRANILHPQLEEIGIGFYFLDRDTGNTNYRYYWSQNFGTPM